MRAHLILPVIGMLVATSSVPALAGDHDHHRNRQHLRERMTNARCANNHDEGMRAVTNNSGPGEPAQGWRYFSDPAACRALVISPQGDYYFSRGDGLRWVAKAQPET